MVDELGVASRRRLTRQLLIGVPLVAGLALFAAKGPVWVVDRGEKTADACMTRAAELHGDATRCTTGAGFALGRLFPEARDHAREVERDLQRRRALLTFDNVTLGSPSVAARDAAAARLIADDPDRADGIDWAARSGAFAAVAAADLGSLEIGSRLEPAFAALALGDVARARTAIAHGDPEGFDGAGQSGALACLLGDRARGHALLRKAASVREQMIGQPDAQVRLAAQYCGGATDLDPYLVSSVDQNDVTYARLFDPNVAVGHRVAIGRMLLNATSITRAPKIAAVALVASGASEPTPIDLLRAIGAEYNHELPFDDAFSFSPWPVLPSGEEGASDYVPPAWLELAATRFAHATLLAPAHLDGDTLRIDRDTAEDPHRALEAAATLSYQFAAGYRLRAGDRDAARRALDQWRAFRPIDLRRAPLEIAAGDPTAALATLDAWQAAHQTPPDRDLTLMVGVNRVLALAATGKLADAHAVAQRLDGHMGAWLTLATAIASNAPLPELSPPSGKPDELTPEALLSSIQAKAPIHGFILLDDDARAVLPAVIVALAHAAEVARQDPDVVVDAIFARQMPSRTIALARAEAARWRHDAAAAKRWDDRAAAIAQLFVDDRAVALAGIAGLW